MNQILVTEKLYVTPELKRKKKLLKIEFFLSVFLVCILSSYYIYAEYDRNKNEQVSQAILSEIKVDSTTKQIDDDDVMIILVSDEEDVEENNTIIVGDIASEQNSNEISSPTTTTKTSTSKGTDYTTEAIITIPKIGISYPVLSETSEKLLGISVNKYWGPAPNEIGNYCIVGHNYKNGKMFGRLSELKNGDTVNLEDMSGRTVTYQVYDRYVVKPTDTSCTSQKATQENQKRELTLITCTNYGKERLVVKCREI